MRDFIVRHKDAIYSANNEMPVKKNESILVKQESIDSRLYTIEPGDTLYGISKKFYGTSKFYKLLMEENKDRLSSPTKLVPGTKLLIPPKPSEEKPYE